MEGINMKLGTKLMFGFGVPIVAIIMIAIVVFTNVSGMIESNGWVDHTHKVIGEAKELTASMVNMETGMRGFLVAGKDEFLEPYNAGTKTFDSTIRALKNTVSDNPAQVQRLQGIEKLKEDWLKEAAEPQITARREVVKGEEADRYFQKVSTRTVGKDMFDGFREEVSSLQSSFGAANDQKGQNLLQLLLIDMINQETGQRGYLLTGQDASLQPFEQGRRDFQRHERQLRQHLTSGGNRRLLKTVDKLASRADGWYEKAATVEIDARRDMNKVTTTIDDVVAIIETGKGKKLMDTIRAELDEFIGVEQKLIGLRGEEAEGMASNTISITIIGALTAALFVLVISIVLTRGILRQIGGEPEEMALISDEISQGNLALSLNRTGSETGVFSAMTSMVDNLRNIVEEVLIATESISDATQQVANGNLDLSQRTEEQASSLEETASSMEEMTSTVKQNADSAITANELASSARIEAEKGGEVVNKAVAAMSDITESSSRIAEIISTIDGISFQTNLLALNAAVEAARAGDQGRGFAVVASEVRTLAQRSADSAGEIKKLIEDSVSKVKTGTELVNQSGETLSSIVEGIRKVADIVAEINAASQEQSSGIDQVSKAITQMDDMTQQNAALVEESAAASRKMQEQASELNNLMSFFKLSDRGQVRKSQRSTSGLGHFQTAQSKQMETTKRPVQSTSTKAIPSLAKTAAKEDQDWDEF